MANHSRFQNNNCWYVDSGASSHMAKDRSVFHQYKPLEGKDKIDITIGNSAKLEAIGIGVIRVESMLDNGSKVMFDLTDVLYVQA